MPLRIIIENFAYHPADITIPAGTTVRFINRDEMAHTATAVNSSFDTGPLDQNQFRDVVFEHRGRLRILLHPHPFMRGFIHVTSAR